MSMASKGCSLLSDKENQALQKSIGDYNLIQEAAIAQLFLANPNRKWVKVETAGVICYIKDYKTKSFFIRFYILDNNSDIDIRFDMVWEQELYREIVYFTDKLFFHMFPAHTSYVGLNFACEKEAEAFGSSILQRISLRHQRLGHTSQQPTTFKTASEQPVIECNPVAVKKIRKNQLNSKSKLKSTKVTKKDIGSPSDFRHVDHVGPNSQQQSESIHCNQATIITEETPITQQPTTSESDSNVASQMLSMMAGKDMKNEDIAFLHNFIKQHGIEKVAEQLKSESKLPDRPKRNCPVSYIPSSNNDLKSKPSLSIRKVSSIGFIGQPEIPFEVPEDVYGNLGMPTPYDGNPKNLYPPPLHINKQSTGDNSETTVSINSSNTLKNENSPGQSSPSQFIPPPPPPPPPYVETDSKIVLLKKKRDGKENDDDNRPNRKERSKSVVKNVDDKNLFNALWNEIDKRYHNMNVHRNSDEESDFDYSEEED